MDIFSDKRLHPGHDALIKPHYKEYFDTVFISFSPFFKTKTPGFSQEGHQKSKQVTFEEARLKDEIFKNMPRPAADIYSYDNENYPSDEEIYLNAEKVSWQEIKEGCSFESFGDINKALKTSIGAYKKVFQRPDLAKRLWEYTNANQIYYPTEGHFEILSKKEIFKAFRLLNKTKLIIEEEFCLNKKELNIETINEKGFMDAINFKDYYIYDTDKELLFAVDWDDFFFLICSNKPNIGKLFSDLNFEGFYIDDTTEAAWELTREEINAGLQEEQKQKETKQSVAKKTWWKL
jgi:hypothetical protein